MAHSKTGRHVNIGDRLVSVDSYGNLYAGTVVGVNEGAETCNATLAPVGTPLQCVTLKDCIHAADLSDFKEKEPVPVAK